MEKWCPEKVVPWFQEPEKLLATCHNGERPVDGRLWARPLANGPMGRSVWTHGYGYTDGPMAMGSTTLMATGSKKCGWIDWLSGAQGGARSASESGAMSESGAKTKSQRRATSHMVNVNHTI
jgi:hypothetical protein